MRGASRTTPTTGRAATIGDSRDPGVAVGRPPRGSGCAAPSEVDGWKLPDESGVFDPQRIAVELSDLAAG